MNCHQGGHTRVLQPGRGYRDFRPGTPLYQAVAIFKLPLERAARTGGLIGNTSSREGELGNSNVVEEFIAGNEQALSGKPRTVEMHHLSGDPQSSHTR
jgi:hypothetical protein